MGLAHDYYYTIQSKDKLEKEIPSMKDYRITSATDEEVGTISFAEIYKHKPYHEEFLKLLEDYTNPLTEEDFEDAEEDSVLIRNLNWFVAKGLITKQDCFKPITIRLDVQSEQELQELKQAVSCWSGLTRLAGIVQAHWHNYKQAR
jgi:hypothetical protein